MRAAAYAIGLLIVIIPLVETAFAVLPVHLHEPPWRLAAVNAFAGAVGLPLVGLFLCFAIALINGDALILWLVSGLCALSSVLSLLGAGSFTLDALQMHGQVRPGLGTKYWIASGWAVFKISLCGLAFLILAVRAGGGARVPRRNTSRASRAAHSVIMSPLTTPASLSPTSERSSVKDDERPIGAG